MPQRVGLIIPSSNRMVEQEMLGFYPDGVVAHVNRLRMTGPNRKPLHDLLLRHRQLRDGPGRSENALQEGALPGDGGSDALRMLALQIAQPAFECLGDLPLTGEPGRERRLGPGQPLREPPHVLPQGVHVGTFGDMRALLGLQHRDQFPVCTPIILRRRMKQRREAEPEASKQGVAHRSGVVSHTEAGAVPSRPPSRVSMVGAHR